MKRLTPLDDATSIELDGQVISAREGESVASAVIAAGETLFSRSPKYHRARGAFCMSGGCSNCLMRVDGVPNVPTCQTRVKPGMRLERQNAFPDAKVDLYAATDLVFRKWFNHNEFLAGIPLAEAVMLKVARHLSGLGLLPDRAAIAQHDALTEEIGTVIVGGGAAGLAAAQVLDERKIAYLLFERDPRLGGRLAHSAEEIDTLVFGPPPERVRLSASVVGLFADAGRQFLAVIFEGRLHLVFFDRLLLANGGQPALMTFENNDLAGVYASRAVGRLIRVHGVLPGKRIAVVGEPGEAQALANLIASFGGEPVAVGAEPVKAHGFNTVQGLTVRLGGQESRVDCDAVALCGPVNPSFELAREGGATVSWSEVHRLFIVEADAAGRTASPTVYVAGELRGPMSASVAAGLGRAAAAALADDFASKAAPAGAVAP